MSKSRITKVAVGIAHTINMGSYESIKPSIEYEATVGEGESHHEVRDKLLKAAKAAFLKLTIQEAESTLRRQQIGVGNPIEWAKEELQNLTGE